MSSSFSQAFANLDDFRPRFQTDTSTSSETDDGGVGLPEIRSEAEDEGGFQHISPTLRHLTLEDDEVVDTDREQKARPQHKTKKKKRSRDPAPQPQPQPKRAQPYVFPSAQDFHLSNSQLEAAGGGEAGEAAAQDDNTTEPYDPFEVRWDEHADDEVPEDDNFCALCHDGQDQRESEANPRLLRLLKHYTDNMLTMDEVQNCRQVSKMYNDTVRPYTDHHRPLPPRMVHEHFCKHAPTPAILYAQEYMNSNETLRVMRHGMLYEINRKGLVTVKPSNWRLYMQIRAQRDTVMKHCFQNTKK